MAVVPGKGLTTQVRERYGRRAATIALGALMLANLATTCAEFAGVAASGQLLGDVRRYVCPDRGRLDTHQLMSGVDEVTRDETRTSSERSCEMARTRAMAPTFGV